MTSARAGGNICSTWKCTDNPGERLFDPVDPVENLWTTLCVTLWKTPWKLRPSPRPTHSRTPPPTTPDHSPERHTGERHSHPHTPPLGVLDKFSPTPKLTPKTTKAPRPPEGRRGANARGSASTSQPPDHHRHHPQNTEGRDVGQNVRDEERPITSHDGRARRPRAGRGRYRPTSPTRSPRRTDTPRPTWSRSHPARATPSPIRSNASSRCHPTE